MTRMLNILVDDLREPIGKFDLVFRSGGRFLTWVKKSPVSENIGTLYLDHDMGEGYTGYEVITILLEEMKIKPREVRIVSSNPVGIQNIGRALEHNGYRMVTPTVGKLFL